MRPFQTIVRIIIATSVVDCAPVPQVMPVAGPWARGQSVAGLSGDLPPFPSVNRYAGRWPFGTRAVDRWSFWKPPPSVPRSDTSQAIEMHQRADPSSGLGLPDPPSTPITSHPDALVNTHHDQPTADDRSVISTTSTLVNPDDPTVVKSDAQSATPTVVKPGDRSAAGSKLAKWKQAGKTAGKAAGVIVALGVTGLFLFTIVFGPLVEYFVDVKKGKTPPEPPSGDY